MDSITQPPPLGNSDSPTLAELRAACEWASGCRVEAYWEYVEHRGTPWGESSARRFGRALDAHRAAYAALERAREGGAE